MSIIVYENNTDYTFEERQALGKAYQDLDVKAQGGKLTLEETRIRVAYIRMQSEDNFKIYQPTPKATRKKAMSVEETMYLLEHGTEMPKVKKTRAKKEKAVDPVARASKLLTLRNKGEILSKEDNEFLDKMLNDDLDTL